VSICLVGRVMFEASLKGHLILAIFTIGALIWHSVPGSFYEVVIPVTAFLLWSLNRAWRAWRVESSQKSHWLTKFYYNSPTGQLADRKLAALKLKVELERPMLVGPGQYVYLIFRGLRLTDKLQAHPFMICWWDDPEDILPGAKNLNSPQQTLHFLIHPRNGLTARLAQENSLESIEVDGPYGQDLHLELYDTVILVARGIGIATMLTYAKRLIKWKSSPTHKRRVLTRKLDLYWELDENCQEKWVGEYLNDLRDKNDTVSSSNFPLIMLLTDIIAFYETDTDLVLLSK
jgi:predicted ferric reductase